MVRWNCFPRPPLTVDLLDSVVTLYPTPELVPPTPLAQTRKAFSFAVNSTIESVSADGKVLSFDDVAASQSAGIPTVVTYLVVGSQRKLVVYCWRDGEAEPVKVSVNLFRTFMRSHFRSGSTVAAFCANYSLYQTDNPLSCVFRD